MTNVIIKWQPGVIKLQNIKTLGIKEIKEKGFFLLLGGIPYKSNLTYEEIKILYLGTSFDQPLQEKLSSYLENSGCVHQYLKNNRNMDLLFIPGIMMQPKADIVSPDTIMKVKDTLLSQIDTVCNGMSAEIASDVTIENQGMFDALVK